MNEETIEKLKLVDSIVEKLQGSSKGFIVNVQEILKRNSIILEELNDINANKEDKGNRIASLVQEMNANLNQIVRLYEEYSKST